MITRRPAPAAPATLRQCGGRKSLSYVAYGRFPPSLWLQWYRVMEESLARLGLRRAVHPRNAFWGNVSRAASKLKLIRPIARLSRRAYVIPIMQPTESRFFPLAYFAEVVPFCFDIWPPRWHHWEAMFRRHRTRVAFFTARQSCAEFARRFPNMECIWVPEACDPATLDHAKPLEARATDVLELGRKYDAYHDLITPRLAELGRSHRFERVKGQVIYDTREALVAGLGESKISVCFPSSLTHPERSGPIETVTMRYYESMGSRCLVVGRCPAELADDFGYNPVVEVDMENAAAQIEDILANIGRYQELVDRNYRTTRERATWDARFTRVLDELAARGYRRPDKPA